MSEEKLLTIREVSLFLGISEKDVIALAENQAIPAYRIGGVYLRFKRQQVEDYKRKAKLVVQKNKPAVKYSFMERVSDLFYFYDFYILSFLIIALIITVILRGL